MIRGKIVLAFALLWICSVAGLSAATFGLFTFTDNGTYITITDYPTSATGAVEIPSSIINKPVTIIGSGAFYGCSGLTSMTIPSSVTSIGSQAFYDCRGLTSVSIPSSVTTIGNSAFNGCSGLTNVSIPSSVTSIGSSAFGNCSGLTSVAIPSSVTSIGSSAFDNCSRLTSILVDTANPNYSSLDGVLFNKAATTLIQYPGDLTGSYTIPSSVTILGNRAFFSCDGLTSVTIPSSVTSIGTSVFQYCRGLTSVTVPPAVTTIGSSAFSNCSGLTSVTIPPSVTSIGSSAFYDCAGLSSVTIPSAVTSIGGAAFYGCSGLSSVTIPSSVTSIGSSAFSYCSGLTSVTIPSSVTIIGSSVFSHCIGLTGVTIPSSVTSIGNSAFSNCSGLASVNIPFSVTSIGSSAFSNCSGLASVTIPSSVTSIGSSAFSHCNGLVSVTIPSSINSIGDYAFRDCSGLTSIAVDAANPNYSSLDGVLFNKAMTTLIQCPTGLIGSYDIPNSVTTIKDYAFSQCRGLTSVLIPSSVSTIGSAAFSGCIGLTTVTIPSSVTSIGSAAFAGCGGLASIVVDAANTNYSSLGGVLFNKAVTTLIHCPTSFIGSFTIPASVTSIGDLVFFGCAELTYIAVDEANPNYSSFGGVLCNKTATKLIQCPGGLIGSCTIPASVASIGESQFEGSLAFRGCIKLTSILVDTANPNYSSLGGVLCNKAGTTLIQYPPGRSGSYKIPSTVNRIEADAFYGCTGLSEVRFHTNVTYVGGGAFSACSGITTFTFDGTNTINDDGAFSSCSNLNRVIYMGNAPSENNFGDGFDGVFSGAASDFKVYYFEDAIGFTSPTWFGYPSVNMGARTQVSTWLIDNQFPYNADLTNDHNGDGISLLMAYALNLDPHQNLNGSMPKAVLSDSQMALNFYAGSEGITYGVETSTTLESWSTEGVTLSVPDSNGYRTAWISRDSPSRFMRLVVGQ